MSEWVQPGPRWKTRRPYGTPRSGWKTPTWEGVAGYIPDRHRRLVRERRRNITRSTARTDFGRRLASPSSGGRRWRGNYLDTLVVGPCAICRGIVTERDAWEMAPVVDADGRYSWPAMDDYPPKKPVVHSSCRLREAETRFDAEGPKP